MAEQEKQGDIGKSLAERDRRVSVAAYNAEAVKGENDSKAQMALTNALLAEKEAEAALKTDPRSQQVRDLLDQISAQKRRWAKSSTYSLGLWATWLFFSYKPYQEGWQPFLRCFLIIRQLFYLQTIEATILANVFLLSGNCFIYKLLRQPVDFVWLRSTISEGRTLISRPYRR